MKMKMMKPAALLAAALMIGAGSFTANAWDLKEALGGGGIGETVGNIVQGVFTKTNLTLKDIVGVWTTDGSAVSFKSDNFLEKAGGIAAAAAIETKINPYFEQLGLNNAVMTIKDDGTFTLKAKKVVLAGTLESNGDGTFEFNFKAFGAISLGKMTAYVQKSGNHVDIMFDATKLKTIISGIAKISGVSLAKTAASLLDSYEGLCVGFGMDKASTEVSSKSSGTTKTTKTDKTGGADTQSGDSTSGLGKAAGALINILKGSGGN